MANPENVWSTYDEHKPANVTTKSDGQLTFPGFTCICPTYAIGSIRLSRWTFANPSRDGSSIAQRQSYRKVTIVSWKNAFRNPPENSLFTGRNAPQALHIP
jgi:hypothetical protein